MDRIQFVWQLVDPANHIQAHMEAKLQQELTTLMDDARDSHEPYCSIDLQSYPDELVQNYVRLFKQTGRFESFDGVMLKVSTKTKKND